ncbi:proteinase-activated receptor 3-like [Pelobates fuscus]|uniref:proteinase-activated receptor 3-like n=1 Tax=Pelobates fuscus TaxID=191477 RepID=UPI002FE454BE
MDMKTLITLFFILSAFILSTEGCNKRENRTKQGRVFIPKDAKCNASILELDIQKQLKSPITTLVLPIIYSVVFIVGLPANVIALWVLAFKIKKIPSTLLLLNLAASDLLFIVALPFKIMYHFFGNNWIFGEIMCRTVISAFYGNMYCSIYFLMAISIDRYIALVHPFSCKGLRGWRASIIICTAVWLIVVPGSSIFLLVPQTKCFEELDITTCHDIWATCSGYEWYNYYFLGLFTMGFAIPLIVVLFCYIPVVVVLIKKRDSYRSVVRVILLVLLTFIVLFTPSNILLILHYLEKDWERHNQLYMWYILALSLTSFNSCIDPFIYFYVSHDFREVVKKALSVGKEENSESSKSTKRSH